MVLKGFTIQSSNNNVSNNFETKGWLHIDIIMPWDYSTIYWNFSVAFFVHTAHGCLIQMCHQNYSKLSGTFFAGEILILYRANSRFRVPPGSNLNLSLMTVRRVPPLPQDTPMWGRGPLVCSQQFTFKTFKTTNYWHSDNITADNAAQRDTRLDGGSQKWLLQ